MTIDKQQLQKLLWAEAASFRADCADWKRNTEALQEFLGEKTVEEVALELLAESEALRKDAERYRRMRAMTLAQMDDTPDEFDSGFDSQLDAAMGKGEQS